MSKRSSWPVLIIGGALLSPACAATAVTPYVAQEVAAPTKKPIEEARTKADHEGVAAYYERGAQTLQEKATYYQRKADRYRLGGGANRILYAPAMKPSRRSIRRPRKKT